MITGILIWHVGMAALSMVIHQLSVRLGRALSDNDRYLPLYLFGAALMLLAGIFWCFPSLQMWGAMLDLVGGGCSAVAAWSYWSWLPAEIRKTREK